MNTTFLPGSNAAGGGAIAGAKTSPAAARLAFLLLFPGFFFYQTLIGIGAMPAFLGGYFSIVSIALVLPLDFFYFMTLQAARYRVPRTDLQFAFFLAYFFLVVAINGVFGADAAIVQTHLFSILYFINIYIIFKTIDFSERTTMVTAWACLLLMSAVIFYFSEGGSFLPGQSTDANVATYQGFARSYLLTFVAVICFTRHAAVRVVLGCIAVAALFMNSSRSELVAVLVLIPLVEIYRSRSRLTTVCLVLVALAVAAIGLDYAVQAMPDHRVWELFNLSQSDSSNARHHLAQRALDTIAEHPLLGAYASYPPGQYAHDIRSAWVDLGLFGFSYLLLMLVPTAFTLFAVGWFRRARSGDFLLALSLICMSLLLLLTAKTFDDMFAGAALGAYANHRSKRRSAPIEGLAS
jgi:hypothetical protein